MLFQIYGENAGWQLFGWLLVFVGLILVNELARRTKQGGIFCFLILPAGLTVYFVSSISGIAQLGLLIGRGAALSGFMVLTVLPILLTLFDRLITKRRKVQ